MLTCEVCEAVPLHPEQLHSPVTAHVCVCVCARQQRDIKY